MLHRTGALSRTDRRWPAVRARQPRTRARARQYCEILLDDAYSKKAEHHARTTLAVHFLNDAGPSGEWPFEHAHARAWANGRTSRGSMPMRGASTDVR